MTMAIRPIEGILAALTLLFGTLWGATAFWLALYGHDIPMALADGNSNWIDQQAGMIGLLILSTVLWVGAWWKACAQRPATEPIRRFILIGVPVAFAVFSIQSFEVSRAIFETF